MSARSSLYENKVFFSQTFPSKFQLASAEGPCFHKLKKTLFQKWMDFSPSNHNVKVLIQFNTPKTKNLRLLSSWKKCEHCRNLASLDWNWLMWYLVSMDREFLKEKNISGILEKTKYDFFYCKDFVMINYWI